MINKKVIVVLIMCILCMSLIFINSSKLGLESHGQSEFVGKVIDFIVPEGIKSALDDSSVLKSIEYIIRKSAHMIEFFVLAIVIATLLFTLNIKGRHAIVYILFAVLLYAVLDEYHQLFVPGRTANVKDILIDFIGGILGTIVFYITYYSLKKNKKRFLIEGRYSQVKKR